MDEQSKKILIVEDEAIISWNIARIAERNGIFFCAMAKSFEEGLEAFHRHQPDVIILDIIWEGEKNGLDLAQTILDIQYIPIICLTAYSTEIYVNRIRKLNIFGYLIKPFDEKELSVMLQLALNQSKKAKVIALEQQHDKEVIQNLNFYFRELADSLPFLLIDFKENGEVFYANSMAKKDLGIKEEKKYHFQDVFSHEPSLHNYYNACLSGKPLAYKILPCKNNKDCTCYHLSFWIPVTLPNPSAKKGVRLLSIPLQEWLDNLLLPREQLWEHYHLSSREIDILRGILQGKRLQTIAKENFISLPTVKYHINQLYQKLGVTGREELYQVLQEKILSDMPPDVFFAYLFTSIVPFIKK